MDGKQLARVARVRAVQLTLARAEEAQAAARVASETALTVRVAQLVAAVAPAPSTAAAFSLCAAAHYRDRLHQTALTAQDRVQVAERRAVAATDAAHAAERDLKAVEKLQARADAVVVLAESRALQNAPVPKSAFRHDPC